MTIRLKKILKGKSCLLWLTALSVVLFLPIFSGLHLCWKKDYQGQLRSLTAVIEGLQEKITKLESRLDKMGAGANRMERGWAIVSWYGSHEDGRLTASGDIFRKENYTVAHHSLPFGTVILFHNPETGQVVPAIVNDRMPRKWAGRREFDLSEELAKKLGFKKQGLAQLEYVVLYRPDTVRAGQNLGQVEE